MRIKKLIEEVRAYQAVERHFPFLDRALPKLFLDEQWRVNYKYHFVAELLKHKLITLSEAELLLEKYFNDQDSLLVNKSIDLLLVLQACEQLTVPTLKLIHQLPNSHCVIGASVLLKIFYKDDPEFLSAHLEAILQALLHEKYLFIIRERLPRFFQLPGILRVLKNSYENDQARIIHPLCQLLHIPNNEHFFLIANLLPNIASTQIPVVMDRITHNAFINIYVLLYRAFNGLRDAPKHFLEFLMMQEISVDAHFPIILNMLNTLHRYGILTTQAGFLNNVALQVAHAFDPSVATFLLTEHLQKLENFYFPGLSDNARALLVSNREVFCVLCEKTSLSLTAFFRFTKEFQRCVINDAEGFIACCKRHDKTLPQLFDIFVSQPDLFMQMIAGEGGDVWDRSCVVRNHAR